MIDIFITNVIIGNTVSGAICAGLSEHIPIFVAAEVAISKRRACSSQKITVQNITTIILNKFHSLLLR